MTHLIALDPNDTNSRNDLGITLNKIACSLATADPPTALREAAAAAQTFDGAMPASAQFRAYPRIIAADAHIARREFQDAEALLPEAQRLSPNPDRNMQSDLFFTWAKLEAAWGNTQAAARWFPKAIEAAEKLFEKTTTPFYGWNLTRIRAAASAALPDTAQANRSPIRAVWKTLDQRFPGEPYIHEQLRKAE